MRDTRIWVCPKLCGCELQVDAEWVKATRDSDATRDNLSYQHPKPFTITDVQIVNVCAAHDSFRTDPLPENPYNGAPGYIRLPIENPTEAQRLYIQLYRYNSIRWKPDTCGCDIYQCTDDTDKLSEFKLHPKHSRKCEAHQSDDDEFTAARENNDRKNNAVGVIKEHLSSVTDDELSWTFDSNRNLTIRTSRGTPAQKNSIQAQLNTRFGNGKVLME